MRWNCPHCAVALAISDETLGDQWNFSRCFQCGGFGLIRRTEVNLVKVDKAPQGEKVLQPQKAEAALMNREATENLTRLRSQIDEQMKVRDEAKAGFKAAAAATPSPSGVQPLKKIPTPPSFFGNASKQKPAISTVAPKTKEVPFALPPLPGKEASAKAASGPEKAKRSPSKSTRSTALLGVTGLVALASGLYLLQEGRALLDRTHRLSHSTPEPVRERPIVSTWTQSGQAVDRLAQRAMAPTRSLGVTGLPEPLKESPPPTRAKEAPPQQAIVIEIQAKNAMFRTGPGTEFRVVGLADPGLKYVVADWKDRWFKVMLPAANPGNPENAAWIRNDLVRLVAQAPAAQ